MAYLISPSDAGTARLSQHNALYGHLRFMRVLAFLMGALYEHLRFMRVSAFLMFVTLTFLTCVFARADTPISKTTQTIEGTVTSLTRSATSIKVEMQLASQSRVFSVNDSASLAKLANAQAGDTIKADVDDKTNPTQIINIESIGRPVPKVARFIALGIALLVLGLAAGLATRGAPTRFLIGLDNRYSNSQCQLALWFGAVAIVYVAAIALRVSYLGWDFIGGVGLPQNLIALSGLSAFTFGGARVITVQKAIAPPGQASAKTSAPNANILTDLFQNDQGNADLGDFQMIVVALAATLIFLLSAFNFLGLLVLDTQITLPDVDSTILSGFGLGQGAYLIKKAASKPGQG